MSGIGNKVVESINNGYFYYYFPFFGELGYWDICAGHALAKEVGGNCFNSDGEELIYPCSTEKESKLIKKSLIISSNTQQLHYFIKKLNDNKFEI